MLSPGIVLQQRYRIKQLLAQGGMGAVYEAEAIHLRNAPVAVKETFFNEDLKKLREQFELEAATLARLRHPALPQVKDHFIEGGGQFLVMDFIEGDDLGNLLNKRKGEPFEFWQVMEWAERLLDALGYIHGQNPSVIHRDIKPQNLKLTPRGELFLIDFGLAKDATTTTRPGQSIHAYTVEFAPPEQIKGEGTDARSDLYSLGATLYHLVTGKLPSDARVREEMVSKHLMPDSLQPAHYINPQVPFAFAAALSKAMALDREQRYQSAQEMWRALRQIKQTIEAEIAERERQEAERRRLEEEERKRLEEARRREDERIRREEEDRLREIERRRQINEAERLKALQEELRKKEEELANLKRVLPHEAVTIPVVGRPDEAVTEPIVRQPDADERGIDREKAALEAAASVRRGRIIAAIAGGIIIFFIVLITYSQLKPVTPEPINPTPDIAKSPEPSKEIAKVTPPSKASETVTKTALEVEKDKLLGKHRFSLQWISWEYFGTVIVSEDKGTISIKGEQRSRENDDYVTIDGVILDMAVNRFKFRGKIVAKISHINSGKPCNREGIMTFSVTGNRKYWRLQEMDNPCDTVTDYVDIFMRE